MRTCVSSSRVTNVKDDFLLRVRVCWADSSQRKLPAVWSPLLPTPGSFLFCVPQTVGNLGFNPKKIKITFPVSFMRSARLQSGNAMKIFRFRDRLAGGALYSGRWGEIPTSYRLCLVGLPTLICNSFHIYFPPFQVCLVFGTLILLAGLIVVLVGYATPTRIEAFGGDDLLFVDR